MTRAQIHLVDNHLTTLLLERSSGRLTEGERALLELLCTDSIYSVKDDFDRGISPDLWVTQNMTVAEHEFGGVLYGTSPEESPNRAGGGALIRSAVNGWKPAQRATVQVRMAPTTSNWQAELGFVSEAPDGVPAARLLSSTTLSRAVDSFGLAVRTPTVSGWYVASGAPGSTAQAAVTTYVSETAFAWVTFLVAVNEQGETRLWINGQHDNTLARNTGMLATTGHYLWLNAERGNIAIDYIEAWQERAAL